MYVFMYVSVVPISSVCFVYLPTYLYVVAYGSPALQPFSIETTERDTNTLTHLAHTAGSHPVRVYIPLSPYRPP